MPSKTGSLLYAQLTGQQRRVLLERDAEIVLSDALNSYTGPAGNREFFQKELENLRVVVRALAIGPLLLLGYVRWANGSTRESKRNFGTLVSQLKKGFVQFLLSTERGRIDISDLDKSVVLEFVKWLKDPERKLSVQTGRRYLGSIRQVFGELEKHPDTARLLSDKLSFPNHAFPRAQSTGKKTERLDDVAWEQLVRACKAEVREILADLQAAWEFFDSGEFVEPDGKRWGRGRYHDIRAVWSWLKKNYGDSAIVPSLEEIKSVDSHVRHAIVFLHSFATVTRPLYPGPEDCFAFALLHAIYTHSNTGPLLSFQSGARSVMEVLGVERAVFDIDKNRGHVRYRRSFPIQEDDPLSPQELHKVMTRWTAPIRKFAGRHAGHAFIFVNHERAVRGFLTSEYDGTDSDQCWKSAVKSFTKKYNLPRFSISMVRTTALDVVREISGDDLRAIQAVGGQQAAAVIELHYEGAAAKRRREERLVHVMVTHERWAHSTGHPDMRGSPENADILAATPGWHCFDPFDSPMPGEEPGRVCRAFGGCPSCPLAFVDLTSAYALARLIQLAEELKAAQFYLSPERWAAAYKRGLEALLTLWIPLFTDPSVRDVAKRLELEPIGEVE